MDRSTPQIALDDDTAGLRVLRPAELKGIQGISREIEGRLKGYSAPLNSREFKAFQGKLKGD